jgi:SAM-dependent methyltransferase
VTSFRISNEAFEYLVVQVGELDGLKKVRHVWERAYERNTVARMNNILPYLPSEARSVLDIGSGLGGINILLNRWYDRKLAVTLLDGDTRAEVDHHNRPFSSQRVALEFQKENGVERASYMTPNKLEVQPFDIILSFRAWCFHIEPKAYMPFVTKCCHPSTVIIADVRRDAQYWREDLRYGFNVHGVIDEGEKFERWVMSRR